MVENPTDEDWAGVKMALISGRPISLQDGPVQPAVRQSADGRAGTVRVAAARRPIAAGSAATGEESALASTIATDLAASRVLARSGSGGGRVRRRRTAALGDATAGKPTRQDSRSCSERLPRADEAERYARDSAARSSAQRLATGTRRQRGDGGGTGRLLPVHHRPPGLARPTEVGDAPHRRQGCRGQKVSHLQPGRPGQAPAARPASSRTPPART